MTQSLIARANRARGEDAKASALTLWRLANKEATGANETERVAARLRLFREALIHAGIVLGRETGVPLATCPLCGETLGRK